MGLQPPSEVLTVLGWLGFSWPEGDETEMFEVGQVWLDLAAGLAQPVQVAAGAAQGVFASNSGDAVEAFRRVSQADDAPTANLTTAVGGAQRSGVAMIVCGVIVLVLKINVAIQVILLIIEIAQAAATAVATGGASLLEIPVFKLITQLILDQLTGMALDQILYA